MFRKLKNIQAKYKPSEIQRFGEMFGMLVMAMEDCLQQGRYTDVLIGVVYKIRCQECGIELNEVGMACTDRANKKWNSRVGEHS